MLCQLPGACTSPYIFPIIPLVVWSVAPHLHIDWHHSVPFLSKIILFGTSLIPVCNLIGFSRKLRPIMSYLSSNLSFEYFHYLVRGSYTTSHIERHGIVFLVSWCQMALVYSTESAITLCINNIRSLMVLPTPRKWTRVNKKTSRVVSATTASRKHISAFPRHSRLQLPRRWGCGFDPCLCVLPPYVEPAGVRRDQLCKWKEGSYLGHRRRE